MAATPETTAAEQKPGKFKPGQSGNPAGRPRGARHKTTLAIEALLEGQAEALTQKAIDLALAGDIQAMRICLDRIAPIRKDRSVTFEMPAIETIKDARNVMAALLQSVAAGEMTPAEANDVARIVDTYVETIRTTDLEERLQRIEAGESTP